MRQSTTPGGIAQLGERLNGIQEVSGSIPLISTRVAQSRRKHLILFESGAFLLGTVFSLK